MRVCPRCHAIYAADPGFCGVDGTALIEQDNDPLIGRTVDRYIIHKLLGSGGMGCVYRARHAVLDREYAVKVLFGDVAAHKTLAERFRREALAVSRMKHENIVEIVDFGRTEAGLTFLTMELIDGHTLSDEIGNRGQLPPSRTAAIALQIARGLAEAHSRGFVHRDLKPGNVMVSEVAGELRVKILDFGIVGIAHEQRDSKLTRTGFVLGTPAYMSPEQTQKSDVGPASDLYALGVICYEMLSGRLPFIAESSQMVMVKHITEVPPPLPPSGGLEQLVFELMAKKPDARPASAQAVAETLTAHLDRLKSARVVTTQEVVKAPVDPMATPIQTVGLQIEAEPSAIAEYVPSAGLVAKLLSTPPRAPEEAAPTHKISSFSTAELAWKPRPVLRVGVGVGVAAIGIVALTVAFSGPQEQKAAQPVSIEPIAATTAEPASPKPAAKEPEPEPPSEPPPAETPPPPKEKEPEPKKAAAARPQRADLEATLHQRLSRRGLTMSDLDLVPSTRSAAKRFASAKGKNKEEAEAALTELLSLVDGVAVGSDLVQARLDRLSAVLNTVKEKLPAQQLSSFENRYLTLASDVRPGLSEGQARGMLAQIDQLRSEIDASLKKR
jgi:eukaryotic-like serine/threonine-protein kinase